jgi:hypothetical protein
MNILQLVTQKIFIMAMVNLLLDIELNKIKSRKQR